MSANGPGATASHCVSLGMQERDAQLRIAAVLAEAGVGGLTGILESDRTNVTDHHSPDSESDEGASAVELPQTPPSYCAEVYLSPLVHAALFPSHLSRRTAVRKTTQAVTIRITMKLTHGTTQPQRVRESPIRGFAWRLRAHADYRLA